MPSPGFRRGFLLVLVLAANGLLAADQVSVVCLGDSITKGVSTDADSAPYPECVQAILGEGFDVVNCGFASMNTAYFVQEFARQIASRKPRWVVILGGVNDVNIWDRSEDSHYAPEKVIGRLRVLGEETTKVGARPMFLTFWPDDDFPEWKLAAVRQINEWILQEAGREIPGAVALDAAKIITGSPGDRPASPADDLHDGSQLHLNAKGHRVLAVAVARALQEHLPPKADLAPTPQP